MGYGLLERVRFYLYAVKLILSVIEVLLCVVSTGLVKKGAVFFRAWAYSFSLSFFYALRNALKFPPNFLPIITRKAKVASSILLSSFGVREKERWGASVKTWSWN